MAKVRMRCKSTCGFVLLDVLVGLLLVSVSLLVIFGNIALASRNAGLLSERLQQLIAERSERAQNAQVRFFGE
jgi:Tfp pilus assembly protein PilV